MTFKAEIKAALGWDWNEGAVDNGRLDYARQLLLGHGEGQAEAVWHAEDCTLLAGESLTLDLTALQRTVLGDTHTVTLLSVKALLVLSASSSTGTLMVGDAATDPWSGPFATADTRLAVPADSSALLSNRPSGWNVDDTHKNLSLTAVGGDVTYSIAIVGTTTASASGSSGA